jgi:hypothetical protein
MVLPSRQFLHQIAVCSSRTGSAPMSDEVRGALPIPGVAMPTWILRYDAEGVCRSPLTRSDLLDHLKGTKHSDVILFSHGWNNDFDAALELYGRFLTAFEGLLPTYPATRPFSPLFVGIVWPSEWIVFDDGPKIAGETEADAVQSAASVAGLAIALEALGSAAQAARFRALLAKPTINSSEAEELSELMVPLLASASDDEVGDGQRALTAADLLRAAEDTARVERPTAGPTNLDDFGGTAGGGGGGVPQAAGWLDKLDPRTYIRLASVYQMKDRAGHVGALGISGLMRAIQASTSAKVHALGHSYGCKVILSGICVGRPLTRPIDSLLLLQPAVSHLCFAARVPGSNQAGGYHRTLDSTMVLHPIMSTYSRKDFPLHKTFHLSLRRQSDLGEAQIAASVTSAGDPPSRYAALGGYGPRGADQFLLDPIRAAGESYGDLSNAPPPIIGLDGSKGRIRGHGDIAKPETAWALHHLIFRA